MNIFDAARYIQSCFEWENPLRSAIAFTLWVIACIYGNLETIPLVLLLIILNPILEVLAMIMSTMKTMMMTKKKKKSIKERLQAIQEVSQTVQNTIGYLASLGESTKK
ncbi:Multiple C2 and transmembrane domain-containing protein [Eumeta japonica]|uniref:Multiple C2 and transmembrane domain-containing protein n=1 Tax=Eumeta variegata TaxID=151549 RepID=A0A4C1SF99_EUMVA|nr:Multiple C2 and transmembrane domain-containing protein [Eumeta japonica]